MRASSRFATLAGPNYDRSVPRTMIIVPLGIIVGLMVGIGLAFFIEYLDTSVKTIE